MNIEDQCKEKNKVHYDKMYSSYGIDNILYWINNLNVFLETSCTTEASWFAIYQDELKNRIKGKRVLEMGCGDCVNAAVMAALGAEVYANDIALYSGEIIRRLNEQYEFEFPIRFVEGDFLENELPSDYFDFVIGKAFLHHLTVPLEELFLRETARLIKEDGEARFFEPAVNNLFLDEIRWCIPLKNRPSKLQKSKFNKWKENDPHPDRTFSSKHFEKVGRKFFKNTRTVPIGTLERFSRLFKWGEPKNKFKRWALMNEKYLPKAINRNLTRSQLIVYKKPFSS